MCRHMYVTNLLRPNQLTPNLICHLVCLGIRDFKKGIQLLSKQRTLSPLHQQCLSMLLNLEVLKGLFVLVPHSDEMSPLHCDQTFHYNV